MANLTSSEDIAYQQARLATLDTLESAYRSKQASAPKSADFQGLRDLTTASARAAMEINRLQGPSGRG